MLRRQVRHGREADRADLDAAVRQLAERVAEVAVLRDEDDSVRCRDLAELVHQSVIRDLPDQTHSSRLMTHLLAPVPVTFHEIDAEVTKQQPPLAVPPPITGDLECTERPDFAAQRKRRVP